MNSVDYHGPKNPTEEWSDILSWTLLLFILIMTARLYNDLPDRVPTHFNVRGQVDGWGTKQSVWLLPAVSVLMFGLFQLSLRFPKLINYPVRITPENAQRQYDLARTFLRVLRTSVLVLFFLIQWITLQTALGRPSLIAATFGMMISTFLVMIPLAVYLVLAFRRK